jgi:hypothetical protein
MKIFQMVSSLLEATGRKLCSVFSYAFLLMLFCALFVLIESEEGMELA